MGRSVERLEGLALVGNTSVGTVSLPTPGLLESRVGSETGTGASVRSSPAPSGRRAFEITDGSSSFRFEVPVLAPEVSGEGPGVYPCGDGVVLVHAPFRPDAVPSEKATRPELVVLGNARALWAEGLAFVQAIRSIREQFGAAPAVWAPRVALPHRIPFLAYLGIDLVDTTEGELEAARGRYLDPTLGVRSTPPSPGTYACPCPACSAQSAGSPDLLEHARCASRTAMAETAAAARSGRLRELVEARLVAEPALSELLRYTDRELGPLFEERTPVAYTGSRDYVLLESHRRPEMVRFRALLLQRYRPPPSKSVLLLVPCSKGKPYRRSRSHRRFWGALEGLPALERVHVVSVSSPIGLVPRELEEVPPARHYDIPVTGDWEESERMFVRAGLSHLRKVGPYRSVVVHLDPREYSFLVPDLAPSDTVTWTIPDDRTTTGEALSSLRAAVARALDGEPSVPGGPLAMVREELESIARVQFGPEPARRLFAAPVRLNGRPWFQRVSDGRNDLATWREERGLFHLTVAGARRLWPDPPLRVEVHPGVPLAGDLFVPGVRHADERIRVGDSVVLVQDGKLAGVGEAALPGRLMTELARGLAVHVRHREHAPTDSPMTEERSPLEPGPVV